MQYVWKFARTSYSCGSFCSNHPGNESLVQSSVSPSVYLRVPTIYMVVSDYMTNVGGRKGAVLRNAVLNLTAFARVALTDLHTRAGS
jgi:hypothetical protein